LYQKVFGIILVLASALPAQTFEELAARAQSLLDSKPAEAADLYKQALGLRADWGEGWLYYGAALYALDRHGEATDAFRKGIALAPQSGTAWAFLGLAEAGLGDSDQALADIRKGEELGLGDNWELEVAIRTKSDQLLVQSSAFDQALAQLVPLSRRNEESRAVRLAMGLCSLAMPQTIAAISPERLAVVELAGRAAWDFAGQRPAQAAAGYKELLTRYPDEPGVHYSYGLYLMETEGAEALAEFRKEVQRNPQHWPAWIVIGSMETRQGDGEAAIQSLKQPMKAIPPKYRWLGHAELGRANLTAGNVAAAISEFETA